MVARNETILKWALYGAVSLLFCMVQGLFLQRITIWGVTPFLFPILAAVVGMLEGPLSGSIYALFLGLVCDLTVTALIPCTYTLIFPLTALCAGLVAQSLLPAGFLCSVGVSAVAFVFTDLFQCLILSLSGKAAWLAGFTVLGRELLLSLPLAVPIYFLFRAVFQRCHRND